MHTSLTRLLTILSLLLSAPSLAQCLPAITTRLGGDIPHVATIDSNRILIANNRALEIYNVSNAAAPVRTGRLDLNEAINKIKIVAGRAYVTTDSGAQQQFLRAYTVSGAAPVFHSTLSTAYGVDFDSSGNNLYIANGLNNTPTTITALDVSPADFPLYLGQLSLPGPANFYTTVNLSISGSRAFISYFISGGTRLCAVNIATPSSMSLLGTHDEPTSSLMGPVVTSGTVAYVCHLDTLRLLSLASFPSFPQLSAINNIGALDASILGSTLFVASSYAGVRPYNIAAPASPSPYTPFNTIGTSSDITIIGDRLYNADREGGISILQIGNPAAITQLGSIAAPSPSRIVDMVDVGSTLYILDELALRIFSTTNPDAPTLLGSLTLPDTNPDACSSRTLGIHNSNAYITGCGNHLLVAGVANPAAPFLRADITLSADYDTAFSGNFAYFCGFDGLKILNISNPSAPTLAATYSLAGVTISVEIVGSTLYLGTRDNGLWILSIANPTAPQLLGYSAIPGHGSCYGLQIAGNTAFVGRNAGLEIFDITNPANPTLLSFDPTMRPDVNGPFIYRNGLLHFNGYLSPTSYASYGLHRVDFSSLTSPIVVGSLPGRFTSFTTIGSRHYMGDEERADLIISSVQTQWKPAFRDHPQDAVLCFTNYALFSVNVSALPNDPTYRWNKDGTPLPIGGRFVGADQANLTILNTTPADAGNYTCTATNSCGSTTSNPAHLYISSPDFNGDGDFGTDADIEAFFACLAGNCCPTCGSPDFNADGDTGTDADIESFFRVLAGGPC